QTPPAARPPGPAHPRAVAPPVPGEPTMVTVLLPSDDDGPLPSPELDPSARSSVTRSTPWSVPAVLLGPRLHPQAPVDAAARTNEAVRAGASIGFLSDFVRVARDLVGRGRVVPSITDEGGRPVARWRALLVGPDAARFEELCAAMPGMVA